MALSVYGRLGLSQHRMRKLGLSQAKIIDPKLLGGPKRKVYVLESLTYFEFCKLV